MTKLWWVQIKSVIRLEMKKTFFARRGLWIYILALLPLLLFIAQGFVASHERGRNTEMAAQGERRLTSDDMRTVHPEMTTDEVIALLGKPAVRFRWNQRNQAESGEVTTI